ncbi:MAG: tannase/feruloyl esterase family alpha/beta hydrolase [Gemmatimonadetes bacterium]|nr:tannase/feruloyl esterase family alpha/beta hydrolase [Gemmatimonadota bacterium]
MSRARAAWPDSSTVLTSATLRSGVAAPPAGPGAPPSASRPMPDHCEVLGQLRERTGVDGQRYAIKFHVRLPTNWNGRFLFQGGGGSDGVVGDAVGAVGAGVPTALDRGFAVLSQDSGHDNRTNSDPARQGALAFAYDPQARRDVAYASLDVTARTGKAIVQAFYGRAPDHSYFFGCSEGGREGMVFAQRFPELFDGIVAAAPGFALPKAAVAEAYDTRAFADLAKRMGLVDSSGVPALGRTFSDSALAIVAGAVLEACDALDGTTDGIVADYKACTTKRVQPALTARSCREATGCLSDDQVATLLRVFGGPQNSAGEALYSDWAWDAGIGGQAGGRYHQGWRMWKIGGYPPNAIPTLNVVLGGASLSAEFTTPPTPVANEPRALLAYLVGFDMDRDAPKIFARSGAFTESSWEMMGAKSTDLSAFRRRSGRLIVPHGMSDPVFSAHDTMRWWDAVNAASGGHAAEFVRVFPVPGMAHCGGGPATDQYDCLTAIVDWVEKGAAPDRILARAGTSTPWPARTRPLCPYPTVARYAGSGSVEDAASFVCRP